MVEIDEEMKTKMKLAKENILKHVQKMAMNDAILLNEAIKEATSKYGENNFEVVKIPENWFETGDYDVYVMAYLIQKRSKSND